MNLPGDGRPGAAGALRYGLQQAILDCAIEGSEEEMAEILTEDLQAKPLSGPQVRQYFQAPPHQWQQLQAMQGQGKPGGI